MRVYQFVSTLAYGDAIGNEVVVIDSILKSMNIESIILCDYSDPRVEIKSYLYDKNELKRSLEKNDIIIYHKSSGSHFSEEIIEFNCKKVMIYHNITPEEFFEPYNNNVAAELKRGREQLEKLKDIIDYAIADSEYNKEELINIGFKCPIDIQPLIIDFDEYNIKCNDNILNNYKKGTNIIFTGRIAPNKKQEDIIKVFYYYKNYVDSEARLFLVGSYNGTEKYYAKLKGFVQELRLKDVYFTGHVKFNDIVSYYKIADVFVCMSEHEGFCVPLIESMYFNIPIICYKCTAIPYTMGKSGVVLDNKDFISYSESIRKLIEDKTYRDSIIMNQLKNLERFSKKNTIRMFKELIKKIIEL